ncbi:hypothetical protein HPULCUR_001971 [Helicostylum pulchrum]|uniref:Velvet domain-containing protein n=1 Tax=Helicostylum pulchrum TaxID=562976 RepID=A0ABP9XR09_9FUNG
MSKINHYNYVPACADVPNTSSSFSLVNRQQPIHARISTNNERDRRPIDPPPIVQIRLNNATPQQTDSFHQNSYFYMCANLAHPIDDDEIYTPTHNALSGQTVSSMYKLKDIDNHDGAFFIFGDLSVKVEGNFRLKLSLFEITSTGAVCLKHLFTSPFTVYPTKKFPGMLDSTFLSRSFSDQGARIRIRKENRAQTPIACRKRKLEIQTEPYLLAPRQTSPIAPPLTFNDTLNPGGSYYERRSSVTSSSTESGSEGSPVTAHFSSPRISLPSLTSPQQSYDKLFPAFSCYSSLPPPTTYDPTVKLPPIRHLFTPKRQKTTTEEDAVLAMMQLSQNSQRLF